MYNANSIKHLLLSFLLLGCSSHQPVSEQSRSEKPVKIKVKGTPISREELAGKVMVAKMSPRIWLAYHDVQDPLPFILNDINAPNPEAGTSYEAVEQALMARNYKEPEKSDAMIVIQSNSNTRNIVVTVVYHFEDGQFRNIELQ